MTVRYLRSIRSRQGSYPAPTPIPNYPNTENLSRQFKNTNQNLQNLQNIAKNTDPIRIPKNKVVDFSSRLGATVNYSDHPAQLRGIGQYSAIPAQFLANYGAQIPIPGSGYIPRNIKTEAVSIPNSNDSESDSDQSLASSTSQNVKIQIPQSEPEKNKTTQSSGTWRPWWKSFLVDFFVLQFSYCSSIVFILFNKAWKFLNSFISLEILLRFELK